MQLQDYNPRLLPDTGQGVGHAEFLGFGGYDAENQRRVHSLDLTEGSHLSQLQLDKRQTTFKYNYHKRRHIMPFVFFPFLQCVIRFLSTFFP